MKKQTYTMEFTGEELELILGALNLTYHVHSQPDKTEVTRKNAHEYAVLHMNVYRRMIEQWDED